MKSWQAQFFVHLGLRLRGRGSVWELSKGRLRAPISRGRRRTLEMQVLKSWQAQYFLHLGLRLRGRGSIWELAALWRRKREIVAGAVLRAPGLAFAWQGQRLGAV